MRYYLFSDPNYFFWLYGEGAFSDSVEKEAKELYRKPPSSSVGNNGSGGAAERDPAGQQRHHELKGILHSYPYKIARFVVRLP